MKNSIIYISLFIALWGLCSCSMEEQYAPVSNESTIQLVPRITSFNGVDVATKADGDAPAFETAIYTAYLLIFDNKGNRVHFSSVAEENGSWSQKVTMKNLPSGTACFIANVPQDFAGGIDTIDELNNAVLDLTYATYTEAGGYLGVPKLTVNGESKLCIPMFGSTLVGAMTHNQTLSIPVKRLFAKISVELKLDMNLSGLQSTIQTLTNYELSYFNLHNLHNKVRLVANPNSESSWKDGSANPTTFQSASIGAKIYNSTSSMEQKSYSFDCYVPEFYLNPKQNPTDDQRYKPLNYVEGTYPIYLELVGQYNAYSITSTDINYKVYLGNDNVSNFSLARNTHYKNVLTIKGTDQNSTTQNNLDHRVTTSTINNPVAQAGESANCYVINATGEYNFPAYKGAYNDLTEAVLCNNQTANELVILANDNSSNIELTDYLYDPERNLISFNVSKLANGNVVLGLMNKDGSLEWSWHLWFNREYDAGTLGQWAQINTQTMPDGTTEMIDRNLGASPSTESYLAGAAMGVYYKYGHRAPYFTDNRTDGNGTAFHGDSDNVYVSWNGDEKSQTDPCPPGYRVPKSLVWSGNATKEHADLEVLGVGFLAFRYWNNGTGGLQYTDDVYYPYLGYLNSNHQSVTLEYLHEKKETSGTITESFYSAGWYKNIKYSLDLKYTCGELLGGDQTLAYGYCNIANNMKITEYSYSLIGLRYTTYKEGDALFQPDIVKEIAGSQIEEKLKDYVSVSKIRDYNTSFGYQVRCVKE